MVLAKKPPLIVTIGTALLLTSGGLLAYWGVKWQASRSQGLPAGVRAVPEETVAVVSFSTNPEQWQRLRQFGTPETQATFDQRLSDWRDRWLTQYGLSFSQDVAPWVGSEVTLAWLPDPDAAPETGSAGVLEAQQRILLVPIADPETAQLAAERSLLGTEAAEQVDYRGVTLSRYAPAEAEASGELWVGLLGTQLILVAEDETAAQRAIDAYRGGKSLADVVEYRRSFEVVGGAQTFGKVYLNVPALTQLLAQTSQPALPTAVLESFQDSRGIAATIAIASQGVQITSASWLGAGSDRTYADTNLAPKLPDYLPRDTLAMASGGDFQQFWENLSAQRNWAALTAFDPNTLELALQGSTGLTLEEDLLPWMGGEFALALVPPPEAADQPPDTEAESILPNPGMVTLVQVSDRPQADQTFAKLDQVVENRYRFTILNEPVDDIEQVKWISPFESVTLARGWLDSNTAFLTVGTGTEDAIVPPPQRSLATAPLFQLVTGDAPSSNNGHFYLNLEALTQADDNLFLPSIPIEEQGALSAIQAIGVTATILDEQRLRYDLFVALQRGNRPGPLPSPSADE